MWRRFAAVGCVCSLLRLARVVVDYICRALPDVYVDKLFGFVASQLADSSEKGFYVTWNQLLLESHGARLKQRYLAVMPTVNELQKSLRVVQDLNKMYAFFTITALRFPPCYVIGQTIIFLPCDFYLSFFFFFLA